MKQLFPAVFGLVLALTACSQGAEEPAESAAMTQEVAVAVADGRAVDAAAPASAPEAPADAPADAPPVAGSSEGKAAPSSIPVSLPKIAYVYDFGYRIDADAIQGLQRKHADLCEKQGPQVCRIIDMRQSGSEGEYADGSLTLDVAAPRARAFGGELAKLAGKAGGEEISSAISGEDLSKQIVDTEARLRARTVLRDRLMEVLASRKGTVAELVEAERGVAQVNEEIDQARSWLAEIQGRVDFSRVNISYQSGSPSGGGFMEPIRGAVGSIGTILGTVFATIIVLLTILAPLGLVGWGGWRLLRKIKPKQQAEAAKGEVAS